MEETNYTKIGSIEMTLQAKRARPSAGVDHREPLQWPSGAPGGPPGQHHADRAEGRGC